MARNSRDNITVDIFGESANADDGYGGLITSDNTTAAVSDYTMALWPGGPLGGRTSGQYAQERARAQYGLTDTAEIWFGSGAYNVNIVDGMSFTALGKKFRILAARPVTGGMVAGDYTRMAFLLTTESEDT